MLRDLSILFQNKNLSYPPKFLSSCAMRLLTSGYYSLWTAVIKRVSCLVHNETTEIQKPH